MDALQKVIHRLEVGGGMRYVRVGLAVLALLLFAVAYDFRAFRDLSCQEAMDAAQLARNIAAGDGYTTLFIRPLSIHLLQQHHQQGQAGLGFGNADEARLNGMHPDLANPPAYPAALAAWMWTLDLTKVLSFHYPIPNKPEPFWSRNGTFWWYQPDFLIGVFNQLLFFGLVFMVYFLARRLFDRPVALLSGLILLGTELFWRFSVSGLSTMLLLVIFAGLVWCVFLLDEETREPRWGQAGMYILAGLAGLMAGIGGLTRYAFMCLMVPVLLFMILFMGRQRFILALTALLAFAAVVTPWMVRNYSLSGTPFGTASFTLIESTSQFPEYKLQRSLEPDLSQVNYLTIFWQKLIGNSKQIIQNDLPKLGGNWISAFFLAGLMIGFRNPSVRRLRYFLVGCVVMLAIVQALGRTQLSEDSPEINSENLLVLVAPLVLVYGVSLFYLLLEQVELPFREMRYVGISVFAVVACLPMILTILAHPATPFNFPPYYPPSIQSSVGYIKGVGPGKDGKQTDPGELMMSDIPWATAWYGYSQCAWLTLSVGDFFTINDFQKPINALYLTPLTIEKRNKAPEWGFVLTQAELSHYTAMTQNKQGEWPRQASFGFPPTVLPLHFWQGGSPIVWPNIFLLTSRQHWPKEG